PSRSSVTGSPGSRHEYSVTRSPLRASDAARRCPRESNSPERFMTMAMRAAGRRVSGTRVSGSSMWSAREDLAGHGIGERLVVGRSRLPLRDDELLRTLEDAHAPGLDEHPVDRAELPRERGPGGRAEERRLAVHGAA